MNNLTSRNIFDINKYFSLKLYLKSLKELAIIAIICMLIISAIGVLKTERYIENEIEDYEYYMSIESEYIHEPEEAKLEQVLRCLYYVFWVVAPLLTLVAFYFLESRITGYRNNMVEIRLGSLFNTCIAAILTWIVIIIAVVTAVPGIMLSKAYKYISLDASLLLKIACSTLVAAVFVTMAVAIGCSVSKKILINVLTGFLVIFLPRAFMDTMINCLNYSSRNFADVLSSAFKTENNLAYSIFVAEVEDVPALMAIPHHFTDKSAMVYTLILCVVYFVIAGVVFCIRESQFSKGIAVKTVLQQMLNVGTGLPFGFVTVALLFWQLVVDNSFEIGYVIILLVAEVLGVIAISIVNFFTNPEENSRLDLFISIGIYIVIQTSMLVVMLLV